MGMDDASFPELPRYDQPAATLPFLMALAGTAYMQDQCAVLESHNEKLHREGRDLVIVGSATSCSKSFVFHTTWQRRDKSWLGETLGKNWQCLSLPFLLVPTSIRAWGHVQHVAKELYMQRFSLHFLAPLNLTNTKPTKGGNGSMQVLQRIRNNCHQTHDVSFTYSKRALRLLCLLMERDGREHTGECSTRPILSRLSSVRTH